MNGVAQAVAILLNQFSVPDMYCMVKPLKFSPLRHISRHLCAFLIARMANARFSSGMLVTSDDSRTPLRS